MIKRAGNARLQKTNHTTSDYYVAYLDVLGTKFLTEQDNGDKYLNDLNSIYIDTIAILNFDKKDIFVKIFSDNILIALKVCEDSKCDEDNLLKFFNFCATIQNISLREGYLIRGAIVKDKFFHNGLFVYGKALIEAEKMERELAIYPRIIAKRDFARLYRAHFIKDNDGCYFLNNYIYVSGDLGATIYFKETLLKNLKFGKNDEKVRQKVTWLINIYNYMIKTDNHLFSFPKITDEEFSNALK